MKNKYQAYMVGYLILLTIIITWGFISQCIAETKKQIDIRNIALPYQWIGNIDKSKFNEPSGICFHSKRRTLFVIGDEGDICEIKTDGSLIKQKRIRHADFEGITHDPATGLLYIAIEGQEKILEIDPDKFKVLREFSIPRIFKGKTLLKAGGQGIEAITFAPNAKHPYGGVFYVANQSFNLKNKDDISAIFEIELPLKGKNNKEAKIIKYFEIGVIDLSGLWFQKTTDHLYVISDSTNAIFELSRTGKLVNSWAFPGDNQEGITVDDEGFMYIAQDSGGIIKIKLKNNILDKNKIHRTQKSHR